MAEMETDPKTTERKRRRRWPWIAAAALALAFAAFAWFLPAILCAIDWPAAEFDLAESLGDAAAAFSNRTASVKVRLQRRAGGGFNVRAQGKILDWPYTARATLFPGWIKADGDLSLALDGTPWRANAVFHARGLKDWDVDVALPETPFSEKDPVLAPFLSLIPPAAASNLVLSGTLKLDARADCTSKRPVPAWNAKAELRETDADLLAGDVPVSLRGLRLNAGARGMADHFDIDPLRPRARALAVSEFGFTNFFASVFVGEKSFFVAEAGGGLCGGDARVYSLYLNPDTLTTGFTVIFSDIDAGQALAHVSGFSGTASGRLHGRLPVFLRNGRELRLRNAYLYSEPGATGTLRMTDASPITDNLAMSGVSQAECDNVAKALADLTYSTLKVDLKRDGDDALALTLRVEGTSTHGKITVPVSVAVTFHGDIEELVNTGLNTMRK